MEECRSSKDGRWVPRLGGAFRKYTPPAASALESSAKSSTRTVVAKRPLVVRLITNIVETFQLCNPDFYYSEAHNPNQFLTHPSDGVQNDGYDNANSDLILHVNSVLVNMDTEQRYHVKEILGQGTFGQVARCWVSGTNNYVAIKIIKNSVAYRQQAMVEVSILTMLNKKLGNGDKRHIVHMLDYFVYQQHLCISFEMLGLNLYEVIKMKNYKGFPLSIVQEFSKQILQALFVIKESGIMHCDLKPENILLSKSDRTKPEIKVIDFGSACIEGRTIYSYIQSRYYRSPEVVVGYPYTAAIDMWSFGCIVAELLLGLPIFSGASELDLLKRMMDTLGGQPPDHLLRDAKYVDKFFMHVGSIHHLDNDGACKGRSAYRILSYEEYEARRSEKTARGKYYFSHVKLQDIIATYPYRKNLSEEEISREKSSRLALVDFLRGLLEFDPVKRWSPLQASRHPFVTGEPFTCPFKPPPETPRIPVMHNVTIDHNPGVGHWLAAGLSPQVQSMSRYVPHNSPHFQMVPLSHGNNFGSLGSHDSYSDNAGFGGSYGSYGDINNMYSYFSPVGGPRGLNMHTQVGGSFVGVSSDARRRPQLSHGNGYGVCPTGSLGPMSLGASPSQFTPPSCQTQISTVSPGQYGSTPPARGSVHGSPLGKAAAVGQYNNRRRNWGYPVASSMQPHENPSQQWQGHHSEHHSDSISSSYPEAYSRGHFGSPLSTLLNCNQTNWRQQTGSTSTNQNLPVSTAFTMYVSSSHSVEVSSDKPESASSLPDPADWDPNYSDALLLQEDTEVDSLAFGITTNLYLSNSADPSLLSGVSSHNHIHASSNFVPSNRRTDGQYQAYAHAEYNPHRAQDMLTGYSRLPHISQNSPSRFGQQPVHRNNQQSNFIRGEQICQNSQPTRPNYYSKLGIYFGKENETSISAIEEERYKSSGERSGHPVAATRPSSHGRQNYGRIS